MRSRNLILWMTSVLLIALIVAGVSGADRPRPPQATPVEASPAGRPPEAMPGEADPACEETSSSAVQMNRLQIDAFQLRLTAEALAEFDLDGATRGASTAAEVLKKLNGVGAARILLRIDEQVNPLHDFHLTNGSKVPVVQDVVVSKTGAVTPSVKYEGVGYVLRWRGAWSEAPRSRGGVTFILEMSDILKSSRELTTGVSLPMFTETKMDKTLAVQSGVPVYTMLSYRPDGEDAGADVQMLIVRMVVTRLDV